MIHSNAWRKSIHILPAAAVISGLLNDKENANKAKTLVASCDASDSLANKHQDEHMMISSPSWIHKSLSRLNLISLPMPRKIDAGEPAFNDSKLKQGILQRRRDEIELRKLQGEIQKAKESGDPDSLHRIFERVVEIAYGKGITAQMRENFLVRYGTTGWTDEILTYLVNLAKSRGIVEIGAGHGQWARALNDKYAQEISNQSKLFEFIIAYDDMSDLPLSTRIYHSHTQPLNDFFFSKVRECADVTSVLRQWTCRARVLLLVYPPPGELALEAVKSYVGIGPENDTLVYVGEGRGGVNANDAFFDFLESGNWVLVDVKDVLTQPGGKGYEKLFILKHLSERSCS